MLALLRDASMAPHINHATPPLGRRASIAKKLGIAVAAYGFFELFGDAALATTSIVWHTPEQQNAWESLEQQYEIALNEATGDSGCVSKVTAENVKDAFIEYKRQLHLGESDSWNAVEAALGSYIDLNVPE
ncbi:MAG: hypothetical protein ACK5Q5_07950 [Planctomycetaceae bacterium]